MSIVEIINSSSVFLASKIYEELSAK